MLKRFLKFAVVGSIGFIVDFATTALFYEVVGLTMLIATGIGFCFAATSNYVLNRLWTWRSTNPNIRAEYIKFFIVALVGLGLHYIVYLGSISAVPSSLTVMDFTITAEWLSKLIATGVVMFWNFGANNFYTFRTNNNEQK